MNNEDKQRKQIADLLFQGKVCSQDVAREIALQLPRVINNFRYLPQFKVEDIHTKWGINLKSVPCIHEGKKRARDYILNDEGVLRLMRAYYSKSSPLNRSTEPQIQAEQPKNPWEMEYESYIGKDGRTYHRPIENKQETLDL